MKATRVTRQTKEAPDSNTITCSSPNTRGAEHVMFILGTGDKVLRERQVQLGPVLGSPATRHFSFLYDHLYLLLSRPCYLLYRYLQITQTLALCLQPPPRTTPPSALPSSPCTTQHKRPTLSFPRRLSVMLPMAITARSLAWVQRHCSRRSSRNHSMHLSHRTSLRWCE